MLEARERVSGKNTGGVKGGGKGREEVEEVDE